MSGAVAAGRFPPAWLVGCGHMAGAMLAGWRSAGVDLAELVAIDPAGRPAAGVRLVPSLPAGAAPAIVLLAVKPQALDSVAPELAPRVGGDSALVSILAGVETASLRSRFPAAAAIVRAMPNQPVAERRGVVALSSADAPAPLRDELGRLFGLLGFAPWIAEEQFDAVTALAGSGPAYVARFLDALAAAGERQGLAADLARRLAIETLVGTGLMAQERQLTGDEIARRVASPGGTTEAGLRLLDAELGRLMALTIDAAARRGAELAAAARG